MYYILCNITTGGTAKYVADLVAKYNITHLRDKRELAVIQQGDLLLVNQLYNTNATVDDILNLHVNYVICVHDFCWFSEDAASINEVCPNRTYSKGYMTCHKVDPFLQAFFAQATLIIYPSFFCQSQYSRFFSGHHCVQPHNDLYVGPLIQTHRSIQGILKIGSLNEFTEMKGGQFMTWLAENVTTHRDLLVEYDFSRYTETNWPEHVASWHGLLHLNKYGETYSYTLTKSLKSGLPMLYNNIGSYRERVPKTPHYMVCAETESDVHDVGLLASRFRAFLDYIIENQPIDKTVFYDNLLK